MMKFIKRSSLIALSMILFFSIGAFAENNVETSSRIDGDISVGVNAKAIFETAQSPAPLLGYHVPSQTKA